MNAHDELGRWVALHYRALAGATGSGRIAARLRKQGWPLRIALLTLLGVRERENSAHKGPQT